MPQTIKERFCFPDALRGIAALWVMGQHLWLDHHTESLFQALPGPLNKLLFQFGYLGVAVFFVLSGFFIANSLQAVEISPSRFCQLLLRRLLRLSPAYYISIVWAIICSAIAARINHQFFQLPTLADLAKHFTYLHGLIPAHVISGVYWTLCIELQFYLVACVLIALSQWLTQRWGWQQAQIGVFSLAAIGSSAWPAQLVGVDFPLPGLWLNFWHSCILGMFAYWSWRQRCDPRWFYGYVGLLGVVTLVHHSLFTGMAIVTALSLYWTGRQNQIAHRFNWPWLQFVGLVSYTLYLTHEPLLKVLFPLGHRLLGFSVLADILCIGFSLASCLGLAHLLHWAVEQPSIRWSKVVGQHLTLLPVPPSPIVAWRKNNVAFIWGELSIRAAFSHLRVAAGDR